MKMGYYNYPRKIGEYFNLSRKDWLKLSKSEKCRFTINHTWATKPKAMTSGKRGKGAKALMQENARCA